MNSASNLANVVAAVVESNRVATYCNVASLTVLFYDYGLTICDELTAFWGTPWSTVRILYTLTRYCAFIDGAILNCFHFSPHGTLSPHDCSLLYQISGWFIFWGGCLAELILMYRTWTIWGGDKRIGVGLCIFFVSVVIPLIYLTHLGLTSLSFAPASFIPSRRVSSCLITEDRGVTILWDYVIVTVFETVILILTLMRGLQHYRSTSSGLVTTLYHDGFVYYLYLFVLSLANVVFIVSLQKKTGGSLIFMQRVFHAILTGRILTHIRLAAIEEYRLPSRASTDSGELSFRALTYSTIF